MSAWASLDGIVETCLTLNANSPNPNAHSGLQTNFGEVDIWTVAYLFGIEPTREHYWQQQQPYRSRTLVAGALGAAIRTAVHIFTFTLYKI